ncbi:hypothetical protein [Maledivibacter halophilus]|uniref:hypothetical protein n=1 Tax=Maledivibacter halophilus TaxID=36842 RepID=UPI001AD8B1FF|nr:hypothetical protein [Maledivibacter halophilus]
MQKMKKDELQSMDCLGDIRINRSMYCYSFRIFHFLIFTAKRAEENVDRIE